LYLVFVSGISKGRRGETEKRSKEITEKRHLKRNSILYNNHMRTRLATPADKEQISHLLDELIEETIVQGGAPTKYHLDHQKRDNMILELINRDDVKVFVVENEGKLLALSDVFILPIIRRSIYHALIEDFVVTKSMRRKGIGTLLMQAIMDYCRKHNVKVIKLTSALELGPAHHFYEKLGGTFTEKLFRFDVKED